MDFNADSESYILMYLIVLPNNYKRFIFSILTVSEVLQCLHDGQLALSNQSFLKLQGQDNEEISARKDSNTLVLARVLNYQAQSISCYMYFDY